MSPVVVVLGAGINGAAVARELALNGVSVWVIDTHDVAFGATSKSSRLIHGGLRYLEYRDFRLVKESLLERERLLQTAPQFVTPLRLRIPVQSLWSGLLDGALKFCGLQGLISSWFGGKPSPRGMLAVSFGLELYDWLAGGTSLPAHQVHRAPAKTFATDRRWVCEYSDCQMRFPERFVLALLRDAQQLALNDQRPFEVRTHATIRGANGALEVQSRRGLEVIEPAFIVNASGAWGDATLQSLGQTSSALFAGTKGTHVLTFSPALRQALDGYGIYAEAADGRLVFILPCGDGTLIGTTDEPFVGDPATAVATDEEVRYLIDLVNSVLPQVQLSSSDIALRQAGVRPLPRVDVASTAAIPRGHSIALSSIVGVPCATLIGGKLTTCRALAEEFTNLILHRLNLHRHESSVGRLVPGAEGVSVGINTQQKIIQQNAAKYGLSESQAATLWSLIGNRFAEVLTEPTHERSDVERFATLEGTSIPMSFVRWCIEHEWVETLEDLVERRLLLTFQPDIKRNTLRALAAELVAAERLAVDDTESAVDRCCERLNSYYRLKVQS